MAQTRQKGGRGGSVARKAEAGPQPRGNTGDARWKWAAAALAVLGVAVAVAAALRTDGAPPKEGGGGPAKEGRRTEEAPNAWAQARAAGMAGMSAELLGKELDQLQLPGREVEPRVVSQSPRIYLFDDLLLPEECEYLIKLAEGRLKPAGVVLKSEEQYTVQQWARNNEQIWMTPEEEKTLPMLRHILKRMHRVAHVPDTDAEGLQVGRYLEGQKYEAHADSDPLHDVHRSATLIVYLSDVESGGDTLFPLAQAAACNGLQTLPDGMTRRGCAICCDAEKPGTIRVRAKRGRGLLFFNHEPSGTMDQKSVHAACPVNAGAKWIAQRWFRLKPYQNIRYPPDVRFDGMPRDVAAAGPGATAAEGPWDGLVRELSRKAPRAYLLEHFLSAEECSHLLRLAGAAMGPMASWLVPAELERDDPVVSRLAKRLHRAAYMPESHGDLLRLERVGASAAMQGQRAGDAPYPAMQEKEHATILFFLNDGEAGGELVLPLGACSMPACCQPRGASAAAGGELRVPPRRGRAVLLYPDDSDPASNGFCTASGKGALWIAQRTFRQTPGSAISHRPDPIYDLSSNANRVVF